MILICLVIGVLGFAGLNVFGKTLFHKLLMCLFAVVFIVSGIFVVLNDHNEFGMEKTVEKKQIDLVSSGDKEMLPILLYQPLGDGKEKVYLYRTSDSEELKKTGTDQVTNQVVQSKDDASFTQETTYWVYENNFYKLLFGIADNDHKYANQSNTFSLPDTWQVLSADEAKALGEYMNANKEELSKKAAAYVQEKLAALLTTSPTLSEKEQQEAVQAFTAEFQQQAIKEFLDTLHK